MSKLVVALNRIGKNIDRNIGWQAATHFHQHGVISNLDYQMAISFERLEDRHVELSEKQRFARQQINMRILNSYSELELYDMGIDTDELTIARNGWEHEYSPAW